MFAPSRAWVLALLLAAWPALADAQAPAANLRPARVASQSAATLFGVSGDTDKLDLQHFLSEEPVTGTKLPSQLSRPQSKPGATPLVSSHSLRKPAIDAPPLADSISSLSFVSTAPPKKVEHKPVASGNSLARFVTRTPVAAPATSTAVKATDANKPIVPQTRSAKPSTAAIAGQIRGKVATINVAGASVELTFPAGQSPPPPGTLVKVYHVFMMGSECVGALETTAVQGDRAVARPLGNFHLGKLSAGDLVVYQGIATAAR